MTPSTGTRRMSSQPMRVISARPTSSPVTPTYIGLRENLYGPEVTSAVEGRKGLTSVPARAKAARPGTPNARLTRMTPAPVHRTRDGRGIPQGVQCLQDIARDECRDIHERRRREDVGSVWIGHLPSS